MKQVNQMAKIFELEKEVSKQREVLTKYVPPTHNAQAAIDWLPSHTHTLLLLLCVVVRCVQNEKGRIFDRQSLRQHTWRTLNAAGLPLLSSLSLLSLSFPLSHMSLVACGGGANANESGCVCVCVLYSQGGSPGGGEGAGSGGGGLLLGLGLGGVGLALDVNVRDLGEADELEDEVQVRRLFTFHSTR